jgi:hypothetical protein
LIYGLEQLAASNKFKMFGEELCKNPRTFWRSYPAMQSGVIALLQQARAGWLC